MTLYVQYSDSAKFQKYIYGDDTDIGLNSVLNLDWEDFYNLVFNILTCEDTGLNIWGQLLNTPRNYYIGTQDQTFGFNVNPGNTTDYAQNFNNGTFFAGATWSILGAGEYRCVLMLRARTFISNLSILEITSLLNDFFLNLQTYGDSTVNYKFIVSVAVDGTNAHQLNYTFKDVSVSPTGQLPVWIATIFDLTNYNNGTYYLPLPVGTVPDITVTT